MRRNHSRTVWVLLLSTFACLPAFQLQGEEAPAAVQVIPELELQARTLPDAALVTEVLHLPPAAVAAHEMVQTLREQEDVPGLPYQNGFQRSGPERRVEIAVESATFVTEEAGELRRETDAPAYWLGRFVVEEAHAFRIGLRDVELPEGAQIRLYAGEVQIGPIGKEMLDPEGNLWLPPAPGPGVVVEIELPTDTAKTSSHLSFTVGDVMEIVAPSSEATFEPQVWTDCDIDATCISTSNLSTIDILRNAVARLSFVVGSGSFLCSGGLMNDKDPSGFRPYLLTANHCFSSQSSASSLVAYFDYRTSTCNGTPPSLFSVPSVFGSTLLATNPVSDFTFVELSANPVAGIVWYLGWTTADPTLGTSMYRVSHPAGTAQKYSASSFTGATGINCIGLPTSDFNYSAQFAGSTTGGSSGSPVTTNSTGDARVVGQLFGVCHFSPWDECSYSTYNQVDGAFSTTYPFVAPWLEATGCGDSFEPDDSAADASLIASGSIQAHSLCPAGDEDWAFFTLGAESAVTLETSGASGDTRMWLFNSSLGQLEFDDDGGSGLFSFIDRTCGVDALSAGTYYVKVDEFGDDDVIDAYNLSFDIGETCSGGCPVNLTLSNSTISGTASYRASDTITLGPSLVVDGNVDMIAGQRIVLGSGTAIGGSFSAGTSPSACTL